MPLRLPFATADDKKYHLGLIRSLCRSADHIVTVSEHSRQDIIRLTGISESRITNTYESISLPERLTSRDEDSVARELEALFGLGFGEYFLFVGAIEPKKNLSRLVDAFAASGATHPLIIVGDLGWMYNDDLAKIDREQFLAYELKDNRIRPRRRVQRIPYVAFDHLISLIRGARALLALDFLVPTAFRNVKKAASCFEDIDEEIRSKLVGLKYESRPWRGDG